MDRFIERAAKRNPALEASLYDIMVSDEKDSSFATLFNDTKNFRNSAQEETRIFREYAMNEAIQQYKDYFEDDAEEANGFFEYLDNLPNRDKIRFMEIF